MFLSERISTRSRNIEKEVIAHLMRSPGRGHPDDGDAENLEHGREANGAGIVACRACIGAGLCRCHVREAGITGRHLFRLWTILE